LRIIYHYFALQPFHPTSHEIAALLHPVCRRAHGCGIQAGGRHKDETYTTEQGGVRPEFPWCRRKAGKRHPRICEGPSTLERSEQEVRWATASSMMSEGQDCFKPTWIEQGAEAERGLGGARKAYTWRNLESNIRPTSWSFLHVARKLQITFRSAKNQHLALSESLSVVRNGRN
jgi:hypothetical protein